MLKGFIKKMLSNKILISSSKSVIFIYHDVSNPNSPQFSELYSTKIDTFCQQIDFISKNFHFISLDELVFETNKPTNKPFACLTFDDGFFSVKENAMPFLNSRNIPFTVFVNKEAVLENSLSYQGYNGEAIHKKFKEKTYLDSNDLRELSSYNVIIGSHSSSHKILSNFCDDLTLEKEIKENKLFLENLLSKEINHFALPYGKKEHFNQKVLDYSFSIGHKAIYTSNPTYFEIDKRVESNKIIPRIGILNDSAKDITFFVNRPIFKKINL